jgi:hypothetical protein
MPSVRRNLELEEFIERVDSEKVRNGDAGDLQTFLRAYFHWKFTGTYLGRRLADLDSCDPERLLRIKELIFETDPADILKAIERTRYIKGLGSAPPAGSNPLRARSPAP